MVVDAPAATLKDHCCRTFDRDQSDVTDQYSRSAAYVSIGNVPEAGFAPMGFP